jgi:di/tricarboxylate transporter
MPCQGDAAPPPQAGLTAAAWAVAATTLLMVIWWICQALPVAVTALLLPARARAYS